MPEAPEIQKLAEALRVYPMWDKKITKVELHKPSLVKNRSSQEFCNFFVGNKFKRVSRRSKYLIFGMSSGDSFLAHQRFTGWFLLPNKVVDTIHSLNANRLEQNVRVRWHFDDGQQLSYIDSRCLAHLKIFEGEEEGLIPELQGMAPDVLRPFTDPNKIQRMPIEYFQKKLAENAKKDVKSVLLDQRAIVSGVGNYNAVEILFAARLNPWKRCGDLNSKEIFRLYDNLYAIPKLSMIKSNYDWFNVFRRKDCKVCAGKILRKVHKPGVKDPSKGQATYYCPVCQGVGK